MEPYVPYLREALAEFACGPGGHSYSEALSFQFVEMTGEGKEKRKSLMLCERCLKSNDPGECLFCIGRSQTGVSLSGPASRKVVGEVCPDCWLALREASNDTGWTGVLHHRQEEE